MLHLSKGLLAGSAGRRSLRLGPSRRRFIQACGLVGLSGFGTTAYGVGIEPESLLVTRYRLTPPGWPAGQRLSINVIARSEERRVGKEGGAWGGAEREKK